MQQSFVVWCRENGECQEDGETFCAFDASEAAERWAEWHDRSSAEYTIVRGTDVAVTVMNVANGDQCDFIVSGESIPTYSAKLVQS